MNYRFSGPALSSLWSRTKLVAEGIPSNPFAQGPGVPVTAFMNYYTIRIGMKLIERAERHSAETSWYQACNTLALVSAHRGGREEALSLLQRVFERQITKEGRLRFHPTQIWQTMGGYSLTYLHSQLQSDGRYQRALEDLYRFVAGSKKASNGSLLYVSHRQDILVDTIGMVCPFLASYSRHFSCSEALELVRKHVSQFIECNTDPETHLPYHAYQFPKPTRLGMQGWGRGTGWYLLGLVDICAELDLSEIEFRQLIVTEIQHVVEVLVCCQRGSGHWGTQVLVESSPDDSSATAFICYAIARSLKIGILGSAIFPVLLNAIKALMDRTNGKGQVAGSSAEALGVGSLGITYGQHPWCDALTAAATFEAMALLAQESQSNTNLIDTDFGK